MTVNGLEQKIEMDRKCSRVIQTSMGKLVEGNYLNGIDLAEFSDSLVYDERTGICFAYDPRDVNRRRLQDLTSDECSTLNCFDCAYTAGQCFWHPEQLACVKPTLGSNISGLRWWQWYEYCEDTSGMCKVLHNSALGRDIDEVLAAGDTLSLSI